MDLCGMFYAGCALPSFLHIGAFQPIKDGRAFVLADQSSIRSSGILLRQTVWRSVRKAAPKSLRRHLHDKASEGRTSSPCSAFFPCSVKNILPGQHQLPAGKQKNAARRFAAAGKHPDSRRSTFCVVEFMIENRDPRL
jgi:hypothetical protein